MPEDEIRLRREQLNNIMAAIFTALAGLILLCAITWAQPPNRWPARPEGIVEIQQAALTERLTAQVNLMAAMENRMNHASERLMVLESEVASLRGIVHGVGAALAILQVLMIGLQVFQVRRNNRG